MLSLRPHGKAVERGAVLLRHRAHGAAIRGEHPARRLAERRRFRRQAGRGVDPGDRLGQRRHRPAGNDSNAGLSDRCTGSAPSPAIRRRAAPLIGAIGWTGGPQRKWIIAQHCQSQPPEPVERWADDLAMQAAPRPLVFSAAGNDGSQSLFGSIEANLRAAGNSGGTAHVADRRPHAGARHRDCFRGAGPRQRARGAGPFDHQSRASASPISRPRRISSRPAARRLPTAITATRRPTASRRCARRSPPISIAAIKVEVSPDRVLVVPGGKVTMFFAIMMFGEPGAEILYPNPGFPIYESVIRFSGATPVPIPLYESAGFSFSADEVLDKITPQHPAAHHQQPGQPDRRRGAARRARPARRRARAAPAGRDHERRDLWRDPL